MQFCNNSKNIWVQLQNCPRFSPYIKKSFTQKFSMFQENMASHVRNLEDIYLIFSYDTIATDIRCTHNNKYIFYLKHFVVSYVRKLHTLIVEKP